MVSFPFRYPKPKQPKHTNPSPTAMTETVLIRQKRQTRTLPAAAHGQRHGLITGATGTGKTVTLQTLAEAFQPHRAYRCSFPNQGRPVRHQQGGGGNAKVPRA